MEPNQTEIKRNEDGTFATGTKGGPGRPPGSSMKEYWKRKFYEMSDEEKEEWCLKHKVSADVIWRMSEGNPKQDMDLKDERGPMLVRIDE